MGVCAVARAETAPPPTIFQKKYEDMLSKGMYSSAQSARNRARAPVVHANEI